MKNNYSTFKDLTTKAGKVFASAVFAVVLLFPSITRAWTYNLASNLNAVGAANICPGAVKVPIYGFSIAATASGGLAASFNGFKFTTNAGYAAASILNFKLWRSNNNTNVFATATTLIQTLTPAGGPGVQIFPAAGWLATALSTVGTTYYFWITMDVAVAPTIGNTVTVAATSWADITVSNAPTTTTGPVTAGGTQTIIGITSQPSTSGSVCAGSPVTVNISTSAGPAWTYQWQYNSGTWNNVVPGVPAGAGYGGQTSSSLNITGLAAGSYSYRCLVGGACGITSNSVTVTVQAMLTYTPQIDAYVNANVPYYLQPGDPNNVTMCFRTSVDFSLYSTFPPVPSYTLKWKVNNTVVGSIPPVTYSTNLLNNGDSVSLVFTNLGTQCYNSPTVSNKWYFTVYPSDPPDAISATISPPPYCIGQNITFTGTVGGQLGSTPTYRWLDNDIPITGATGLSYTGTFTAGTHPISFVVQSSDTCSSPPTDTLFVTNLAVGLCYDTMPTTGWSTITRCGGVFYDDGGPAGPYSNANSTGLLTILPATPGQYVTVTFTSFSSELNIDRLRIFSGTDTSTFLGQLTGTGSACGTFTSAASGGGLTFKWITNGSINGAGWVANLGCSPTPSVVTPGMNCSNPINIATLPYSVAGQTNNCFSNSHVSGMGCATTNVGGNDNFYKYVATGPECITIFVNNATNNLISLNVYEGCPGAVGTICIATWSTAVGGSLGGQVTLPNPGIYYFVVDANTGVTFTYNLNVNSFGSAPLNDLPCNAEVLIQTVPHFDDNSCAGTESGGGVNNASCVSGNINSLWYSFTTNPGQISARIRFTRALGTLPDLNVQVYSGTCSALSYISCNALSMNGFWDCPNQPQLQFATSPSTVYFIRVDGLGNATGSYQIIVDDPLNVVPAYGYDCGNPISISSDVCTYGTPAFIGVGDQCDFPTSNNAGFAGERDGVFFLFQTIAGQNGVNFLTFDIYSDPSVTTDWDFIIWNVTAQYPNSICSYISNGSSWNTAPGMISSSWVDTYAPPNNGHTGCRSTGVTNLNGLIPAYNAPIPLSGTQWWMLYISNFRVGQFPYGFTLDLNYAPVSTNTSYSPTGPGAVVLNPAAPPQMIWWTGQAGNTDWFNVVNWGGCAVPSCSNNTSATVASFYSPSNPFFPSVGATGAITKNLTIRPSGSLTITPAGQLDVCGNWLNIGTFTAQSGSTVRATSDQFQYFDGTMSGSSAFSNLIMTKSLAPLRPVTLFNKAEVTGALTLTAGKIVTNAKELYISNNAPSLFIAPNGNNNSYVQGNLRRSISASGGSYDFPVGIASSYQRANINFTTATTIPTILSSFTGTAIPIQPGPIGPECPNYDYSSLAPLNNGYWTMSASANATSGTYNTTLYNTNYSNSGGAFAWTVLKAATSAGPWLLNGTCAGASTANATVRNGMNGFSVFTAGQAGNPGPVPVELLTLTASLENTGVSVNWETASEINNDHFDIERSRDGEHFEKIGIKTGAGNSTVNLFYSQYDPNPYSGINYYRLKQVDFDGTYNYSDKVYVVVNPEAGMVSVYPNPAQTDLWCDFYTDGSGKLQFEIMDVLGKTFSTEVREAKEGLNEEMKFNISNLPQGVYFIRVRPLDGSSIIPSSQMRFVKQMKEE